MADIVPFAPKQTPAEDKVWCCAHCDNSVFELYQDGTTGCRSCRSCGVRGEHPDGRWSDWTPIDDNEPTAQRSTAIFDSAEFAQRATVKAMDEDTSVLIVGWNSGRIRAWSKYNGLSTDEEKNTVRYLTAQATSLILGEPALERPDDVLEETE